MKKIILSALSLFTTLTSINAQIRNGGFEDWQSFAWESAQYSESSADNIGSIIKTTDAQHGSYAIKMKNYISDDNSLNPAYFLYGTWNNNGPQPGFPYSQKPSTLNGYYKSDLGQDTAIIGCIFFKSGSALSQDFFFITGNHNTYTPFSFNLTALNENPDSVTFVMTSSNAFGQVFSVNSWLQVDNISFGGVGISQQIPNGSFEQWINYSYQEPQFWHSDNNDLIRNNLSSNAVITNDAYEGTNALQLTTSYIVYQDGGSNFANEVRNFEYTPTYKKNGIVYDGNLIDTLYGYYKYDPAGTGSTDTGFIYCEFYKSGFGVVNSMYGGYQELTSASNYTKFTMPLDFTFSNMPDSVFISIGSSNWPVNSGNIGSVLIIDNISLASNPLGIAPVNNKKIIGIKQYPNPCIGSAYIEFNLQQQEDLLLTITDISGRIIFNSNQMSYHAGLNKIIINTENFASGEYFYTINGNKVPNITGKIVVIK